MRLLKVLAAGAVGIGMLALISTGDGSLCSPV